MTTIANLREFEALARERLSPSAYAYYAGGSWDEQTMRDNEAAFARRHLLPRVLVDVAKVEPRAQACSAGRSPCRSGSPRPP